MASHSDDSPYREASSSRPKPRGHPPKPAKTGKPTPRRHVPSKPHARPEVVAKSRPSRGRSRSRKKGPPTRPSELTSHPTSRNAQVDTRAWLLHEYGPVCAYCGLKFPSRVMTLDHVAPRRGQTAYDRRDNLVLCCRACNALKADLSPLAFLLRVKSRAANLLKYGAHLSAGLRELARPLAKGVAPANREVWGSDDDGESPYRD